MQQTTINNFIENNRWQLDPSSFNAGQDADKLIRYIPDINRENLDAVVTALKAIQTVEIPQTQNKPWAGTWNCGRIYFDYDRNKHFSLFQVLHRGGTTVDDIRTLNGCQYRYTTQLCIAQDTILDLPAQESGIEYERSGVIKDNDTGRFTYSITKKERLYQTVPEYVSRISPAGSVMHAEHLGVREGDKNESGDDITIPSMESEPGIIKRIDRVKQSDCTQNIIVDRTIPADQTSVSEDHSAARDAVETLHTEGATISDKSAAAGTIRQVQEIPTEAGNVRTIDKVITPKDQESTGGIRSAAADTDIEEHTEGTEITDLSAAAGTIRRVDQTPTEAGNMRTRDAVTTPKDQTSVSEDHSAARDAVETLHTEGATISDKSAAAGTIRQVQEIPTEAGNVRTIDKVITPKDQESTSKIIQSDETTNIEEHTEGPEITNITASAGTIRRVNQTPTEAGNMRTRDEVTTRLDQSITSGNVVKTPRQTSTIAIIDGASSAPSALGADEYGRVSYRKDRFGRYVGEREVTTYTENYSIPGWTIGSLGTYSLTGERKYIQKKSGDWYYKEITYTIAVSQHSSYSAAMSSITGGLADSPAGGSRIIPLANRQYLSIKVTVASGNSWTSDSTLNT